MEEVRAVIELINAIDNAADKLAMISMTDIDEKPSNIDGEEIAQENSHPLEEIGRGKERDRLSL